MTNPPPFPGQPYGQQQPYGQMPGYPGSNQPQRMTRPLAPGPVTGAFVLYVLAAAVSVVSVLLLFTESGRAQIEAELRRAALDQGLSGSDLEAAERIAVTVAIVVVVLFIALYLLFAFMMRAGRNWARIVLTVLSALSIAGSLGGTASPAGQNWATWVSLVFSVLAIVLMYLTPSNQYFQQSKQFRAQQHLYG